jgi:hypothetical protein
MKYNNCFEEELFELCPIELRKLYLQESSHIPSIYHCVGTNKLIGEFYGRAICNGMHLKASYQKIISSISCLLRSYIVLDDFIKDYFAEENIKNQIFVWLENIKNRILLILDTVSNKSLFLWNQYLQIYEDAYTKFDQHALYNNIIDKCGLIFLIFEIEEVKKSSVCEKIKKIMKDFLFSLQLLDDFQDMEEDILSPKNHNIYLCQNSPQYHELICKNRHIFHNKLFEYTKSYLSIHLCEKNPIIHKYILNSVKWLESNKIGYYPKQMIDFPKNIELFEFRVNNMLDMFDRDNYKYDFSKIRAENIHTI